VSAAQSSGEWPGVRVTCREGLTGLAVRREGAKAAVERVFVGGTRRDAAAEGGGRRGPLVDGRGGGGIEPKVRGFSDGGPLVGALEGEGNSLLDESADEGNAALGVADGRRSASGESWFAACTVEINIDGELSQGSCFCSGASPGLSSVGCECRVERSLPGMRPPNKS